MANVKMSVTDYLISVDRFLQQFEVLIRFNIPHKLLNTYHQTQFVTGLFLPQKVIILLKYYLKLVLQDRFVM
jgi:hypothetical protein